MPTAAILKFLSLKIICTHVRQNFWKASSNSEHFKFFLFFCSDGYQFATSLSTWKPNFAQIGGFLYSEGHFWFKMATIANQNVAIWCSMSYPFPLKSLHFWIFSDIFYLYFHFEMAAILRILKTKNTTLSDDLFLCQASKGSAVLFEFNIFAPWLPWQRSTFWICSTPKSCHTLR